MCTSDCHVSFGTVHMIISRSHTNVEWFMRNWGWEKKRGALLLESDIMAWERGSDCTCTLREKRFQFSTYWTNFCYLLVDKMYETTTSSCSAGEEIYRLLWNPKMKSHVNKIGTLVPIVNHTNSGHILRFKVRFNIILPSCLGTIHMLGINMIVEQNLGPFSRFIAYILCAFL